VPMTAAKKQQMEGVMPWNSPKRHLQGWESESRTMRAFGCNVGDALSGGQST
jgi:hypothetical protein